MERHEWPHHSQFSIAAFMKDARLSQANRSWMQEMVYRPYRYVLYGAGHYGCDGMAQRISTEFPDLCLSNRVGVRLSTEMDR